MAQPEKSFRLGTVQASVFVNEGQTGPFRTVQLQRRFQDAQGEWQSSSSYTLTQLLAAIKALQLAADYLIEQDSGEANAPF